MMVLPVIISETRLSFYACDEAYQPVTLIEAREVYTENDGEFARAIDEFDKRHPNVLGETGLTNTHYPDELLDLKKTECHFLTEWKKRACCIFYDTWCISIMEESGNVRVFNEHQHLETFDPSKQKEALSYVEGIIRKKRLRGILSCNGRQSMN
jgi:hypothetical protein